MAMKAEKWPKNRVYFHNCKQTRKLRSDNAVVCQT